MSEHTHRWPPVHVDSWHNSKRHTSSQHLMPMDNDGDLQHLLTPHATHRDHTTQTNTDGKRPACQTPEQHPHPMQTFPHKQRDQCMTPTKETHQPNQQQHQGTDSNGYMGTADLSGTQSKYNKSSLVLFYPVALPWSTLPLPCSSITKPMAAMPPLTCIGPPI